MKVLLILAVLLTCSVFMAHGKPSRTYPPGLEGSTVGNLTGQGCYSGRGSSSITKASMDRCCRLRACCYAKLAAGRCRLRPPQPLSALRARIPTCRSGTWCQRGACRCEQRAQLCRARDRGLLRPPSKCQGRVGRC